MQTRSPARRQPARHSAPRQALSLPPDALDWQRTLRGALWTALVYAVVLLVNTEEPLAALAVVVLALALMGPQEALATGTQTFAAPRRNKHRRRRPARIIADHRHVLLAPVIVLPPARREPRIIGRAPPPRRPRSSGSYGTGASPRRSPRLVRRYA